MQIDNRGEWLRIRMCQAVVLKCLYDMYYTHRGIPSDEVHMLDDMEHPMAADWKEL